MSIKKVFFVFLFIKVVSGRLKGIVLSVIIIIIIFIIFMEGTGYSIPETNHVSRVHSGAAIL